MRKLALILTIAAMWLGSSSHAQAQVAHVTYFQPTVVYHAPTAFVPQTVFFASAPPQVVYKPVARVRTRHRPILGGSVTRVRYGYAPAYVLW